MNRKCFEHDCVQLGEFLGGLLATDEGEKYLSEITTAAAVLLISVRLFEEYPDIFKEICSKGLLKREAQVVH